MNENKTITYIPVEQLRPHPDNPRKDLGDLTELTESIKKNGIMQNLTVIPIDGEPDQYMLLIGHRRYAAGKAAGLKEYPCQIVHGLSRQEQLSIMLEENLQRNDLTIIEQANGFQMMLDLGMPEEEIAEKTGFSRTTIRHRLNIAKLDQKILKEKQDDQEFQLSITDLYELEKVKNIKTRNKILKESFDSRTLIARARNEARDEKREERAKAIGAMLKKAGVKKAPQQASEYRWDARWDKLKNWDLDEEVPEKIVLPKTDRELMYIVYFGEIHIISRAVKGKKELSREELDAREVNRKEKQIKAILKAMDKRREEFIRDIIQGKIKEVDDTAAEMCLVWDALIHGYSLMRMFDLQRFMFDGDFCSCTKEEMAEAEKKAENLKPLHQMLIILHHNMKDIKNIVWSDVIYREDEASKLIRGYAALEPYGWYLEDEEKMILDGTHELYTKVKEP